MHSFLDCITATTVKSRHFLDFLVECVAKRKYGLCLMVLKNMPFKIHQFPKPICKSQFPGNFFPLTFLGTTLLLSLVTQIKKYYVVKLTPHLKVVDPLNDSICLVERYGRVRPDVEVPLPGLRVTNEQLVDETIYINN